MKGIASPDTTMGDLYRAALPFVGLNFLVMGAMIGFPSLVLWLPSLMREAPVPGSRHLGSPSQAGDLAQAMPTERAAVV
jgi:hypothetical protein